MKFPTIEEMARDVAEKALDEYEYKGKTLRQWIEIILATASEDTISRQAAIDAVRNIIPDNRSIGICKELEQLPPAEPQVDRPVRLRTKGLRMSNCLRANMRGEQE